MSSRTLNVIIDFVEWSSCLQLWHQDKIPPVGSLLFPYFKYQLVKHNWNGLFSDLVCFFSDLGCCSRVCMYTSHNMKEKEETKLCNPNLISKSLLALSLFSDGGAGRAGGFGSGLSSGRQCRHGWLRRGGGDGFILQEAQFHVGAATFPRPARRRCSAALWSRRTWTRLHFALETWRRRHPDGRLGTCFLFFITHVTAVRHRVSNFNITSPLPSLSAILIWLKYFAL